MSLSRRWYCWRVGGAVVFRPEHGEKCPECGSSDHDQLADLQCGHFISDPLKPGYGSPCERRDGHDKWPYATGGHSSRMLIAADAALRLDGKGLGYEIPEDFVV